MQHHQRRDALQLWLKLEEARDIVASSRSSTLLRNANVDAVTYNIVGLQNAVLDAIRADEVPEQPKLVF